MPEDFIVGTGTVKTNHPLRNVLKKDSEQIPRAMESKVIERQLLQVVDLHKPRARAREIYLDRLHDLGRELIMAKRR